MDRILRREEVQRVSGLSRSTLYEMVAAGAFPGPVKIGRRAVGWRESEVTRWLESRPRASDTEWR